MTSDIQCHGQHGWREFSRNREDLLSEFDKSIELNSNRPVRVAHGVSLEASLRRWLSEFLPKKFGVTSGYIIPSLYDDSKTIYHYDIIIYDQLESPILWIEGNPDQSEQGKHRAIPAKHVLTVYEVKSRLTKDSASKSLLKLSQTGEFFEQLHPSFRCGAIFGELKTEDRNKESIARELANWSNVFGFSGGMILRYEADTTITGLIRPHPSQTGHSLELRRPLAKPIDDLAIHISEDGKMHICEQGAGAILVATSNNNWSVSKTYTVFSDSGDTSTSISWSRTHFSTFCMALLNDLEGVPQAERRTAPYFGQIFDEIERKKAPDQPREPQEGRPFLRLRTQQNAEERKIVINHEERTVSLRVYVQNTGDTPAQFSDDQFRTSCKLEPGQTATKTLVVEVNPPPAESIAAILERGLDFSYRLIYRADNDPNGLLLGLERMIRIAKDAVEIVQPEGDESTEGG